MTNLRWHLVAFFAIIASITLATAPFALAANLGAQVDNVATVSYQNGPITLTIETPPASFVIEAIRTPSTIEFFRVSPNAPDAISIQLNGSNFSPSGDPTAGDFTPVGPAVTTGGRTLDFSSPLSLAPAEDFFTGELVIVGVTDLGQNGNPTVIETITATIVTGPGDTVTLELFESGPNTGQFFAYIPSAGGTPSQNDAMLSVASGEALTATYQDPFVDSDVSTDVAGVDPFGRLFDSATGELLDGVTVTIVDDATGQPAPVFGIDGVSDYPNTIVTGAPVTDASGQVYNLEPGQFVFPIMFPGVYRLVIEPPLGYTAPSIAPRDSFDSLPNAPFTIVDASFGGAFILDGTGDVTFDVPLDPQTDVTIQKSVSTTVGAIGDFVRYAISIENSGPGTRLTIEDTLPRGFRYQEGTARLDGVAIIDPVIASNGRTLTFDPGVIAASSTTELTYVTEIAAGAETGDAVNTAIALNAAGNPVSNRTEAAIEIRDEFLRNSLTIVGRVVEGACNPDEDWPREISEGRGVPGVRIYMETGAYVVSDEDGLFHFENVDARPHVVQLDKITIPDGYSLVQCEENTRYAGSAFSKFIDAQGGSVWRANFYLQNDNADDASTAAGDTNSNDEEEEFTAEREYLKFDREWLNQQDRTLAWAYPTGEKSSASKSVNLGLKHDANTTIHLFANEVKVSGLKFDGRIVNDDISIALSRWRGLPLVEGENVFEAVVFNQNGEEIDRIQKIVYFVTRAMRVEYVEEASNLVADGVTAPVIAVRVTDEGGRPVHAGRQVPVEIAPPYRAFDLGLLENQLPLQTPDATRDVAMVGDNGVALIKLQPTTQTGKARLRLQVDDNSWEDVSANLKPALREWIVVGLAEGTGALSKLETSDGAGGTVTTRDAIGDGRIAIFAKGSIKEKWLVTFALDTAEGRGARDDELFDVIDPDDRFPLYGDRSVQQFEAQSSYPVYAKVENGGFQALFGDYDTDLNDSELGRYTRRLSGLKSTYESDRFSLSAFAAETNQGFVQDEIAADGTSGPFRLSTTPIVRNSETVTIETRDRFRPDIIVESQTLTRFLDYDIDFTTGEFIFRQPIPAAENLNAFNVIVVDYETTDAVERNITAGGRGAVRFAGGRAELGGTIIYEQGRVDDVNGESQLAAIDLKLDITKNTRLLLEYGVSRRETDGDDDTADALVAELEHISDNVHVRAFYRETEDGFGLGQQTSAVSGVRRYGVEFDYLFDRFAVQRSDEAGTRHVKARAYREENLSTGANRTVAEAELRQEGPLTSAGAGLRYVVENPPEDGAQRESLLATLSARQNFPKLGLSVYATRDQPIFTSGGASTFFPKRTTVGLDKQLFDGLTLNLRHEIQEGDNASSANTVVGLTAQPWTGSTITLSADAITQDSGQNIGATLGVDQQVRLTEKWTGSFGMTRRQELASDGEIDPIEDIVPDAALSPLEVDQNFTSLYVGAGYRGDHTTGSARYEVRKSETGTRHTGVAGAARQVSERLSFAGAARIEDENNIDTPDRRSIDARLGTAWRPRDNGVIVFHRLDVKSDTVAGELESFKIVNNLAVNAQIAERMQLSLNHGVKYSRFAADDISLSGITQLIGVESRYDLTEYFDVGFRGSALISHNAGTIEYAYGPSLGVSPVKNVWLSAGYNVAGFSDDDFAGAEFTDKGPYVQLRIKFDQDSARGLLDRIRPGQNN